MKFFLFWFGVGLAGIASTLIWAAVGSAATAPASSVAYLVSGLMLGIVADLIVLAWAQTHRWGTRPLRSQ